MNNEEKFLYGSIGVLLVLLVTLVSFVIVQTRDIPRLEDEVNSSVEEAVNLYSCDSIDGKCI